MTYVIEPSTFGIGYSIFRVDTVDGKDVKVYIADVPTVAEAGIYCPNAVEIICPAEARYQASLSVA